MKCFSCSNENPATAVFCQVCGSRLDLKVDEIAESLYQRAEEEAITETEKTTRQILVFAVVLFIISITIFISINKPVDENYLPSATIGANYVKVEHSTKSKVEKMLVPLEEEWK